MGIPHLWPRVRYFAGTGVGEKLPSGRLCSSLTSSAASTAIANLTSLGFLDLNLAGVGAEDNPIVLD